jgi:hypothetical protein
VVSSTAVGIFVCREVDDTSYLVADFSIICYDAQWEQFQGLAIAAIVR